GKHGRCIAVGILIFDLYRLVDRARPHNGDDRPKDLFPSNGHLGGDVVDNRRTYVSSRFLPVNCRAAATNEYLRAVSFGFPDITLNAILSSFRDDRTQVLARYNLTSLVADHLDNM